MKDEPRFTIEIQIKDEDVNVFSLAKEGFILTAKDKSLLLIALHQLKEKIINEELKGEEC